MTQLPYKIALLLGSPFRWLFGIIRSTIHGDAHWMTRREMKTFLNQKNRGLVLSHRHRLSIRDSFNHMVVVAPTGAGKSKRYVIPNILDASGSVVVTDPSGEIYARTSGAMQKRGFKIKVFQPSAPDLSLGFNPLRYCRSLSQLRDLAGVLANHHCSDRSEPFWTVSATNLLYVIFAALSDVEDERYRNLANALWLLNNMGGVNSTGMHWFMAKHLRNEQLFTMYKATCAYDSKVLESVLSTARVALELWFDPDVCRLTAADTIQLEKLRQEKTVVYLTVREHKIAYFSLILNLFYWLCFSHCLENPDGLPVFFMMDEFGNLGKIKDFSSMVTTLRKHNCSVNIILQELSQLTSIYGPHEARTMLGGGCNNRLFFGGLDLETCRYLEGLLGQNTEYDTTFGGIDDRARTVGVPLLRSDKVRMMRKGQAVFISGSERPIRIKNMPFFFEVPRWKRRASMNPAQLHLDSKQGTVEYLDLDANTKLASI